MTFVDDNGNQLNFDGQFAITKRSVSLLDGKVQGDTSTNFSIDNNSVNRKVLGYNGPQMLNQVAATKQPFNRVRNGNIIDRGYIVIQDDYEDILDCYYVSGNSNWIQVFNAYITDLDYTGVLSLRNYAVQMNDVSVAASVGKTYGVIFPIADWWSNYQRGKAVYNSTNIVYGGKFVPPGTNLAGVSPISSDLYNTPIFDFYPCFFISSLLDEMTSQLGIKISGTLLQDQLFKTLIIPPSDGLIKRANLFSLIVQNGTSQVMPAGSSRYTSFTEVSDNDNLFSSGRFTADAISTIKITINIISFTGSPTITIFKNGSDSSTLSNTSVVTGYTYINYLNVIAGDYVDIIITGATTIVLNLSIECQSFISYDNYVLPSDFLPKIKCVDLIKMLINYFGCSSYFDDFSNTLILNIIENYKKEDAEDWSSYYISHRNEYTANTAKHNYVNVKQNSLDARIQAYNNSNIVSFGSGDIITDNNLIDNTEAIKLPFSSSYFDKEYDGSFMSRVPLVQLSDTTTKIPFTAITDLGSGLSSFTLATTDVDFFRGEYIRVINSLGTDLGLYRIPGGPSSSVVVIYIPFWGTDTGYIIKQSIKYNSTGFYLLSNATINCWDLYPGYLNFGYVDPAFSIDNTKSNHDYATFVKYKTGLGIDRFKTNLCIDRPNISGVSNSIRERYLNKVSNFFKNPPIRMSMLLPEAKYKSYNYDKFIFVKSEKLTGYFYIDSIANYIDGNTPVEVNVYML